MGSRSARALLYDQTMMNTTTSKMENGTDVTIRTNTDEPGMRYYTREHRYASLSRDGGTPCVDLTVNLADDGATFYVRWNANRGRAWGTAKVSKRFATELEARAFAATKWDTMLTWLTTCEPRPAAPISLYL